MLVEGLLDGVFEPEELLELVDPDVEGLVLVPPDPVELEPPSPVLDCPPVEEDALSPASLLRAFLRDSDG